MSPATECLDLPSYLESPTAAEERDDNDEDTDDDEHDGRCRVDVDGDPLAGGFD